LKERIANLLNGLTGEPGRDRGLSLELLSQFTPRRKTVLNSGARGCQGTAFSARRHGTSKDYVGSASVCIHRVGNGESARQTAAVTNAATAICPKTFPYICTVSIGSGTTCGPPLSSPPKPVSLAITPDSVLASPRPTNQAPITVLTRCLGDNFVTIDSPIGD